MGLDCSHGAFNGSSTTFNNMRRFVAESLGGSWDGDGWCFWDFVRFKHEKHENHEGLHLFLLHSDCDGIFTAEECQQVHEDLEWFIKHQTLENTCGNCREKFLPYLRTFSAGCLKAAEASENLEFL